MNQVSELDATDPELEDKMNAIAEAVARAQKKMSSKNNQNVKVDEAAINDPQDAYNCEGCQ